MSKRSIGRIAACLALTALLFACETQKRATIVEAPEANSIKALTAGFSPTGDPGSRAMRLGLGFGNRDTLQLWKVEIVTGSIVVKTYTGSGAGEDLPKELAWDGKTDSGSPWPEGEYYALLAVKYDEVYYPSQVAWDTFFLVSSPPRVDLAADPPYFTPEGLGMAGPVAIGVNSKAGIAKLASWSIEVHEADGAVVKRFEGTRASDTALWDGSVDRGGFAEPSKTYTAVAAARDEYGNVGRASLAIGVKEQTAPPETSLIETEMRGFSPLSERNGGKIDFSLKLGSQDAIRSWKVEIAGPAGTSKSLAGEASSVPAAYSWDGRDDSGALAPEGVYAATLTADYGRTYKSVQARTKDFILSSAPPDCRLSTSPDSFVPADKGVAAPLAILLDATPRLGRLDTWSLDLLDAQGRTVRSFALKWPTNQAVWDGMTDSREVVETGATYRARAVVVDEFGNKGTASATISVKDIPPPTELSVIEPRSPGFSPLGSGKPRSVEFILVAGNAAQMKSWKVAIVHAERGTQRVFSGAASALKRSMSWDGKTEAGAFAPDGGYYAALSIDYGKSFKPASVKSPSFALQSAPPEASLSISPPSLIPRAGAFESPVAIDLRAGARLAEIESWIVSILDPEGKTVALFKDATPGGSISWDGSLGSGRLAEPSSVYSVVAEVRDSFGNTGFAKALIPVEDLPPVPGQAAILPSANGLSPNGDGVMDSIEFALTVPNEEAVKSWKVVIGQGGKGPEKTFSGDRVSLKGTITWSGRSDSGALSPEGAYYADMSIDYGTIYKSTSLKSRKFVLVSTPPKARLEVAPQAVVPDERGLVAPASILVDGSSTLARMSSWYIAVTDGTGALLNEYAGAWPPKRIAWDGVATAGFLAQPSASYTVTATVNDEFGITDSLKSTISVGALPQATEPSLVAALSKGFSPAGKGAVTFALAFGNPNLIKAWNLDIERDDRTLRLRFPGTGAKLPDSFSWDGLLQDGTVAPDGLYLATLSIDYGRVYAPVTVSSDLIALVATPPTGRLAIDPPLFSPDGISANDTVRISLDASSRYAKLNDWGIDIYDPGGNLFTSFRGQWPAKPISWDGKNAKNELVESAEDYPVVARARDEFGNVLEMKSAVRVDILILKVGDGYRIRIASIVFKPFTADYLEVAPDIAERNVSTLNLLADKLKKFPGYQIRMVGHAVMVNWDNPALGKAEQEKELIPLSKSRAASIKAALAARGIEAARMVTDGVGASDQIVPDSDFANRWKNRRVEFFLKKNP